MSFLWILSFIAGSCIALQAAMNARLGQFMDSALLATSYAFVTSFFLVIGVFSIITEKSVIGQWQQIPFTTIPWYLWGSCVLSAIGVGSMYWLIPKIGVGTVMSYALTGQLIIAMLISHFGLFESPKNLISTTKIIGSIFLVIGIVLLNKD